MTYKPTDAELDALRQADNGDLNFVTLRQFRIIARAALAKWGSPVVAGPDDDINAMGLARYKVVPAHESMFHRFAVVAGDGQQQLYLGRETECQNMARKFAGAFLDGAFYHSRATQPTQAQEQAGSRNSKGYVSIRIDGKQYKAHRIAWLYCYGVDPGDSEIDHIDMDKANNAIANLRLATRKQNNENIGLPKNSTSGVRGVSFQKNEKHWTAYIYHNRKRIHLGCFKEMQPAVEARIAAEAALFTHSSGIKGGQHAE